MITLDLLLEDLLVSTVKCEYCEAECNQTALIPRIHDTVVAFKVIYICEECINMINGGLVI